MISIYSGGNHVENSANISNKEQYTQINKTKSNMIKKWETDCLAISWKYLKYYLQQKMKILAHAALPNNRLFYEILLFIALCLVHL